MLGVVILTLVLIKTVVGIHRVTTAVSFHGLGFSLTTNRECAIGSLETRRYRSVWPPNNGKIIEEVSCWLLNAKDRPIIAC